ncbi:MAG: PTS ascorbate transporter subunit IIC [Turicibacter sp.]|nr:PTS ascorbate transporter subunit IIC [Turicibacter sp.]
MEFINDFIQFLTSNILTRAELFVGLIVLLGYSLQKKKWYESFGGFLKAVVGYLILMVGSNGLITTFRPILVGLNDKFNLNAVVIDPYFGLNAANEAIEAIGASAALCMTSLLVAFIWNIILLMFKKWTKVRTLLLTGHIMVQQATTVTWIVFLFIPQFRNIMGAILVGILVGTYQAVTSNMTVEACENLTDGKDKFAIGHQQMFAIWITDKVAKYFGNKDNSVESLKLPGFLQMFNDTIVATSVLMLIFFGTIMGLLGEDFMRQLDSNFSSTTTFPVYIFIQALYFTVYLQVLQIGVKMFVTELTQSFKGISDKLLPGAIPAVDCAVAYGFAPGNTMTIGFFFGTIGQVLAILGLLVFRSPVMIIMGFATVFFDNATLAVFANKRGGIKAAMIIPFICGVFQVLLGAITVSLVQLVEFGGWHGTIDFSTVWLAISGLLKTFSFPGALIAIILMLMIPQIQYAKSDKSKYFDKEVKAADDSEGLHICAKGEKMLN